ncbi:hypothetical protein BDV06DRAFT_207287 [Aspergillus oleicola]
MGGYLGFLYNQLFFAPQPLPRSVDLRGQTAIVTGANVGLGLEAAKQLAARELSRLILGVRTVSKGETAAEEIRKQSPKCDVQVWQVDQENWDSMKQFGETAQKLDRLDIVILNAGVKCLSFGRSPTGHERHVQVNHLATALFSLLLLPPLQITGRTKGSPARLTIVTSEVHFWTDFSEKEAPNILARLDEEESFRPGVNRYCTSKLLNVLWLRELSDRAGSGVVVNGLNPGLCASEFHRSDTALPVRLFNWLVAYSAELGGRNLVNAAILHEGSPGAYISEQAVKDPSPFVLSNKGKEIQRRLWEETVVVLEHSAAVDLGLENVLAD